MPPYLEKKIRKEGGTDSNHFLLAYRAAVSEIQKATTFNFSAIFTQLSLCAVVYEPQRYRCPFPVSLQKVQNKNGEGTLCF